MRVCLVTPYGLDRVSGITTVLTYLAVGLVSRGHPPAILSPAPPSAPLPSSVLVWAVPGREPFRSFSIAIRTARFLWLHRDRWDIVHVHQGHLQTLGAALVARALGRPAVATFHLRPPPAKGMRGAIERISILMLLWAATDRVFVSRATMAAFRSKGSVIPNGILVDEVRRFLINREALRHDLGLSGFVVAFAGRKARIKGYLDLLDALQRLRSDGVDARLLVTGDSSPEEAAEVARRVRDLGLESCLLDLGLRDDHLRFLAAADAFALPSYAEGMPMGVVEAMAAGLPIVATGAGGLPEILTEGVEGFLVSPGDVNALADRLGRLARDPALRAFMGSKAAARSESFDEAVMVSAYLDLYSNRMRALA